MAYEKSFADGVREHATDDSPKGAVISSIMQARDQVLKAMDNNQWPAREVHEAFKAY